MPRRYPRRIATVSVHTSPLEQPGTGDAGGLNVYVVEVARRLADRGVEVDIFTRAVSRDAAAGGRARSRSARAAPAPPGRSRTWTRPTCPASCATSPSRCCGPRPRTRPAGTTSCTATTGCPARSAPWPRNGGACRSCSPCTPWARVKNAALAAGDAAEPEVRLRGEAEVVAAADRLVANTDDEAQQLIGLYDAVPVAGADHQPRRRPGGIHARVPAGGPAAAGPARRRGRAGLRRPHAAAQGPAPGPARGGPR